MVPCLPRGAVLFDLDGTLVDSVPDITAAANVMLAAFGRPPVDEATVRSLVGRGTARLVVDLLADEAQNEGSRALSCFMAAYRDHLCERTQPYPGVAQTLRRLHGRGIAMACVTNKPLALAEELLRRLSLRGFFRCVVGAESAGATKPDPAPLRLALSWLAVSPDEAFVVGDSVIDVQAARSAGCLAVCVDYGYNQGLDLSAAGADLTVSTLAEIGRFIGLE